MIPPSEPRRGRRAARISLTNGLGRTTDPTETMRPALHRHAVRAAFDQGYAALRAHADASARRPGATLVALDENGGVAGVLRLDPAPGRPAAAVIGRHPRCDLVLRGEPRVSLRHAAVLALVRPRFEIEFAALDLRARHGLRDEHGARVAGLRDSGALVLRLTRFVLFLLPTGDGIPWPDDPSAGWACLPFAHAGGGPRATHVSPSAGDDEPIGWLTVRARAAASVLPVGAAALRRGVLVGRSGRCAAAFRDALDDRRFSRLHLLVADVDGRPFAVDLASTNGARARDSGVRAGPLEPGVPWHLGGRDAAVSWAPAEEKR